MTRFSEPLTKDTPKLSVAAVPGMAYCLDEMAQARGISRAELLRRVVAQAIVEDVPYALSELTDTARGDIERLADL
jgi:hypothetical protein